MFNKSTRRVSFLLSVIMLSVALCGILLPLRSARAEAVPGVVSGSFSMSDIPDSAFSYNGHWYCIYSEDSVHTWQDAFEFCRERNGYLATLTSAEENDFVFSAIRERGVNSAYFGLSDYQSEGNWRWCTGEQVEYTNWHSGEPNSENPREDYAMFYYKFSDGSWNDGDFGGSTVNGGTTFICEWGEYTLAVEGRHLLPGYDVNRDKYHFKNFSASIPEDVYKNIYGDLKGAELYKEKELSNGAAAKHGLCYGMAATTACIMMHAPDATTFVKLASHCECVHDINKGTLCTALNYMNAKNFIFYGYATQFSKQAKTEFSTCEAVYNAVYDSIFRGGSPVLISFKEFVENSSGDFEQSFGHRVLAVGIEGDDTIIVDDSNFDGLRTVTLERDSEGHFTNRFSYPEYDETRNGDNSDDGSDGTVNYIGFNRAASLPTLVVIGNAVLDPITGYSEDEDSSYLCGVETIDTDANLVVAPDGAKLSSSGGLTAIYGDDGIPAAGSLCWADSSDPVSALLNDGGRICLVSNERKVGAVVPSGAAVGLTANDGTGDYAVSISAEAGRGCELVFRTASDTLRICGSIASGDVVAGETDEGIEVSGLNDVQVSFVGESGRSEAFKNVKDGSSVTVTVDGSGRVSIGSDASEDVCPYCGRIHTGTWGTILRLIHMVLHFFGNL